MTNQKNKILLKLINQNIDFLNSNEFKKMDSDQKKNWFDNSYEKLLETQTKCFDVINFDEEKFEIDGNVFMIVMMARDRALTKIHKISPGLTNPQDVYVLALESKKILNEAKDHYLNEKKKILKKQFNEFKKLNEKILNSLKNFFNIFKKEYGKAIVKDKKIKVGFINDKEADPTYLAHYSGSSYIELVNGSEIAFLENVSFINQKLDQMLTKCYSDFSLVSATFDYNLWIINDQSNLLAYWFSQIEAFLKDNPDIFSDSFLENSKYFNFSYYKGYDYEKDK